MAKEIPLKKALDLVTFYEDTDGIWCVDTVHSSVCGNVEGAIGGDVEGDVEGNVWGTIAGRDWEPIETPEEKFRRLLGETGNQELIEAFNQLEDN